MKAKVNSTFKKELSNCFKVHDGVRKSTFYPQQVLASTGQGYRVSREMLFFSTADMQKMLGCTPSELGMEEQQILDENNQVLKGVAIANNNFPLRRLQVFGSYATVLEEEINKGDQMLRKDQNKDMHGFLVQEAIKARPKPMRGPGAVLTWEAVTKKYEEHKAKASLEPASRSSSNSRGRAQERAPLAPAAPAQQEPATGENAAAEASESEEEEPLILGALAGVPKPKAKAKTRHGSGKKRAPAASPEPRRRLRQKLPPGPFLLRR